MNVLHPLEGFTTIFGWMQFQNIWDILVGTGIAFIPFLLILIQAFVDNYTGQEAKAGSRKSVHMMEVEIVKALSVVVLAAQPVWPLSISELEFEDPCGNVPDIAETTYPAHFDVTNTAVPVWWYMTMAVSKGITGAAIAGIGCPEDMVRTRIELDLQRISDPEVAQRVQRFIGECFVPARSWFQQERPEDAFLAPLLAAHGQDDPEFIGSEVYLQLPGFYNHYRATSPVHGFEYVPARDDADYNEGAEPDHGRPFCDQWWRGVGGPSLRQQILDEMDTSVWDNARNRISGWFGASDQEIEDRMIRRLVDQSAVRAPHVTSGLVDSDTNAGLFSWLTASFGIAQQEMFSHGPMMLTIRQVAPIVQSFLLMGIYMLLPILLVVSLYSWWPVFIATMSILTITFWSYLWAVSRWLENNMTAAMYPDGAGGFIGPSFGSLVSPDLGMKDSIINMTIGLLHIGLPLLFSMIVGWAGYKLSDATNSARNVSGSMESAGGRAGASAGGKLMEGSRRR